MAFPDVIKVLKKLIETIKRELQTKLTEDLLKDYMHYEFLTRKIKIMPDQPLGQRQIDEIDNLSIIDIFVKIVKANLFPDPPETVVTQGEAKLQFRKFNLKLYFGQFRVLIL